jgi:hypothetical protein
MDKVIKLYLLLIFCGTLSFSTNAIQADFDLNPWNNYQENKTPPMKTQSQTVLKNEHPVFTVNIYNPYSEKISSEIKLVDHNGQAVTDKSFQLRAPVKIRTKSGALVADPLPKLDKQKIITIPGKESRQLWIEFDAAKLNAGIHEYILEIIDINNSNKAKLKLSLNILPVSSAFTPDLLVWDCSLGETNGKARKLLLEELVSSGVNIFHLICPIPAEFDDNGNMHNKPDFKELDSLVNDLKPYSRILLLRAASMFKQRKHRSNHKGYLKSQSGKLIPFGSPAWKNAVTQWTKAVSKHLAEMGISNSKWALYPYDEYLGSGFVTFAETAKTAVPQIQIFGNPAGRSTQDYLGKIASQNLLDIICPTAARYYSENNERKKLYEALKNTNVRKLFYFAGWPQKDFSPLKMYRFQSWRALAWRTSGWAYWTATGTVKIAWSGNPWDDFDTSRPNPEALYIEKDTVVPSRRWRAVRAGIEDYALVKLVQKKATTQADKNIIDKAITQIMSSPDDYKNYNLQRKKMIELLIKLEGLKK